MKSLTALATLLAVAVPCCPEARASQPPPITFPQALYDHESEMTEWWYYTGNLDGVDGHQYGFELTFFRDVAPTGLPAGLPQTVPVIFADLAVSDLNGQKHYFSKQITTLPSTMAGIVEQPWSIFLNNWTLQEPATARGLFHLSATQNDFGLDLYLLPEGPPVLNGNKGLFVLPRSDGQGKETFEYYSYPRLLTAGLLRLPGKTIPVAGLSWNDHEFFTLRANQGFPSWDWFSIQLTDGSSIMLYGLRRPDGSFDPASPGTYVDPNGQVTHLTKGDYTLTPGSEIFHSAVTGANYPISWSISIPREQIALTMTTPLKDQEMPAVPGGGSPSYWEGASRFAGTKAGQAVSGKGYLEMLGYATQ